MAIIKYRVKARGRPRELDTNQVYKDILSYSNRASQRLAQIRKETKGIRGEQYLGSQTSLPDFIEEALDLLESYDYGREATTAELTQISKSLQVVKNLASKQSRVYGRALEGIVRETYVKELEREFGEGSKFSKKTVDEIKKMLDELSPRQRQGFFTSRHYQDVRTMARYKRVKDWAESDSGRTMAYQESWAYLLERRLEDYGNE